MTTIRDRARKIITDYLMFELGCEEQRIVDTATFAELGCDGLDSHEIILALEDQFHVEIDDDVVEGIVTIGQAIDALGRKVAAAQTLLPEGVK